MKKNHDFYQDKGNEVTRGPMRFLPNTSPRVSSETKETSSSVLRTFVLSVNQDSFRNPKPYFNNTSFVSISIFQVSLPHLVCWSFWCISYVCSYHSLHLLCFKITVASIICFSPLRVHWDFLDLKYIAGCSIRIEQAEKDIQYRADRVINYGATSGNHRRETGDLSEGRLTQVCLRLVICCIFSYRSFEFELLLNNFVILSS